MRNLTRVSAVLVGVLGATGAVGASLAGCGNDSTGIVDGGPSDAGTDQKTTHDSSSGDGGHDARHDVTTDAPTPPTEASTDTGSGDTSFDTGHDTGAEAGHEAGLEGGPEAGSETGVDAAGDGGLEAATDAPVDAGSPGDEFPTAVVSAYCNQLAGCCGGTATFDVKGCIADGLNVGAIGPTYLGLIVKGLPSDGHSYNPAAAATCLNELAQLSCGSNEASTLNKLAADCSAAYTPKDGQGAKGCKSSFDCQTGDYCAPIDSNGNTILQGDAGTFCVPLQAVGQPCVDIDYSSDCTYLGSGSPGLFCNNVIDGGLSDAGGVCTLSQLNGTSCSLQTPEQCISQQCEPSDDAGDYACANSANFTNPGFDFCQIYALGDGG